MRSVNNIYPELKCKPDMEMCLKRIYAWYEQDIIDRPPVRFSVHNSFIKKTDVQKNFSSFKERWFDAEYQVVNYKNSIEGISLKVKHFLFSSAIWDRIYIRHISGKSFFMMMSLHGPTTASRTGMISAN